MQSLIIWSSDSWLWLSAFFGSIPNLYLSFSFQDSGLCSNYCYTVWRLFLSTQSTSHYLFDIANLRPPLISCSWKCPNHCLYSPGLGPWSCLWLMTCLQHIVTNQSLSSPSAAWKCFSPLFIFLLSLLPSMSYYWSFQTDFPGSSPSWSLSIFPLPPITSYLKLSSHEEFTLSKVCRDFILLLGLSWIVLLWSSKALTTWPHCFYPETK